MNSATASCASSSIVVDSKNARSFSGSDGIVRTLPWSGDDTFGDAGHSATGVEGPRTKTKGWGTDLVPVPQPFGEQARMPGGGTLPRVPCFRAHDETVAIAYGGAARPIALVDELRVSRRRAEHPG